MAQKSGSRGGVFGRRAHRSQAARRLPGLALLVPLILVSVLASAAQAVATFSLTMAVTGPSSVTVGQTNVPAGLGIVNNSTGLGPVTLTSITYHPSCADFALACTAPEPGVFSLSPVATGLPGTGCSERAFTVAADGNGRYIFTANPAIVLAPPGAAGSSCTISFTFDVLRTPTIDSLPGTPGVQTTRSAMVSGSAAATGGGSVTGTSRSIASITVLPNQPSITTQVSAPAVPLGSPVSDTATVTGAPGVALTGTVTFTVFGPNDSNCGSAPVSTSLVALAAGTATSSAFTATAEGTYRFKAAYSGDANNAPVVGVCNAANETFTILPAGRYVPLTPARILDTRTGTGGVGGALAPGSNTTVQITGRGGVPASGVTAVAMNVTVTEPTANGFLTLYPTGTVLPLAANLNFTPNKTVPNLVVVKLGTGGKVDMYNPAGATQVIYDVTGYFTDTPAGNDGRYVPLSPVRILDTRDGTGGFAGRLGPGASIDLQITGRGGIPATGPEAVAMNVAVTTTDAPSYLTVYPTGEARPLAANLNWVAGDTNGNRVIAKLGSSGRVTIFNAAGDVDVIVDTNGWFTDASVGGTTGVYVPVTPARILDTRIGTGGIGTRPAGSTIDVHITGQGGVPASGVSAVILNATVVSPAGPGFLTLYPTGTTRPLASDLNYTTNETRPNLVVVKVGDGGLISLFTPTGTDVVFDVAGFFT